MATLHLLSLQKTYFVDIRRIALTDICLVEKEKYNLFISPEFCLIWDSVTGLFLIGAFLQVLCI